MRHQRAEEHRRNELESRLVVKKERNESFQEQKMLLTSRRQRMAMEWAYKHGLLKEAKEEFAWKGKFVNIPPPLQDFKLIQNFNAPKIPVYLEDLDEEAVELQAGETREGTVEQARYHDYKFFVSSEIPRCSVRICLKAISGDPDVYVGNGACRRPRKEEEKYTWHKSDWGDDKMVLYYWEETFSLGWLYISVRGSRMGGDGRCDYELSVDAKPMPSMEITMKGPSMGEGEG